MKGFLFIFINILVSLNLQARPVLSSPIGARSADVRMQLYPDHQDRFLFHYFSDSSTLVEDKYGYPKFSYTFTPDYGYFSATVKRENSPEFKQRLKTFLAGDKRRRVAHLPIYTSSLVSEEGGLISSYYHAPYGAPVGAEIGFSGETSGNKSLIFAESLRNRNSIRLQNCYNTKGLSDYLDASINIKMKESYKEFNARLKAKAWFFGTDIKTIVRKLVQNHIITIKTNGGNKDDDGYIREISDKLIKKFMTPLDFNHSSIEMEKSKKLSFLDLKFKMNIQKISKLVDVQYNIQKRVEMELKRCTPVETGAITNFYNEVVKRVAL